MIRFFAILFGFRLKWCTHDLLPVVHCFIVLTYMLYFTRWLTWYPVHTYCYILAPYGPVWTNTHFQYHNKSIQLFNDFPELGVLLLQYFQGWYGMLGLAAVHYLVSVQSLKDSTPTYRVSFQINICQQLPLFCNKCYHKSSNTISRLVHDSTWTTILEQTMCVCTHVGTSHITCTDGRRSVQKKMSSSYVELKAYFPAAQISSPTDPMFITVELQTVFHAWFVGGSYTKFHMPSFISDHCQIENEQIFLHSHHVVFTLYKNYLNKSCIFFKDQLPWCHPASQVCASAMFLLPIVRNGKVQGWGGLHLHNIHTKVDGNQSSG
jgi:hypothetical protein